MDTGIPRRLHACSTVRSRWTRPLWDSASRGTSEAILRAWRRPAFTILFRSAFGPRAGSALCRSLGSRPPAPYIRQTVHPGLRQRLQRTRDRFDFAVHCRSGYRSGENLNIKNSLPPNTAAHYRIQRNYAGNLSDYADCPLRTARWCCICYLRTSDLCCSAHGFTSRNSCINVRLADRAVLCRQLPNLPQATGESVMFWSLGASSRKSSSATTIRKVPA